MNDDAHTINLAAVIVRKLVAGRYRDFADVIELIRDHSLDESFGAHLRPSAHADFTECLEARRREDEYELQQDRAFEEMQSRNSRPPSP